MTSRRKRQCRCPAEPDHVEPDQLDRDPAGQDPDWTGYEGYLWTNRWYRDQRGPMVTTLGVANSVANSVASLAAWEPPGQAELDRAFKEALVGRKLPDSLYCHETATDTLPTVLYGQLERAIAIAQDPEYDVVKIALNGRTVSLLQYPTFFDDPHPQLTQAITVNLETEAVDQLDYSQHESPPILHRKEEFLDPEHPRVPEFRKLTRDEQARGLLDQPDIGNRSDWEELLSSKGLAIEDHEIRTAARPMILVHQGVQRLLLDQIRIRYPDDYHDALDEVLECPDCYQDDEPVGVLLERGVYWLQSGHHRFVTAQVRGDRDILVWLEIQDSPVQPRQAMVQCTRDRDAGPQELELERLFAQLLPGTQFANKVFAVGGYVRDQLQGLEPADLDLVIELPYGAQRFAGFLLDTFPNALTKPEPLTYDFPIWYQQFTADVVWAGEQYQTKGAEIDLTDSQTLEQLDNGATTRFGPLAQDVERRDFTVNMLFKDLTSGDILDPTGTGQRDIERGVLRGQPHGDQARMFAEQPRQMLRLVRFMVQYGWDLDPVAEAALQEAAPHLAELSRNTIEREFLKWRKRGVLDQGLVLLREFGMLKPLREAVRPKEFMAYTAPRSRLVDYQDTGFSPTSRWGTQGSGCLFTTGTKILLLERSQDVEEPGTWGLPGGAIPEDETGEPLNLLESALAETQEELGRVPAHWVVDKVQYQEPGFCYTTFVCRVGPEAETLEFNLNWENDQWGWFTRQELDQLNLHFGVMFCLSQLEVFR